MDSRLENAVGGIAWTKKDIEREIEFFDELEATPENYKKAKMLIDLLIEERLIRWTRIEMSSIICEHFLQNEEFEKEKGGVNYE